MASFGDTLVIKIEGVEKLIDDINALGEKAKKQLRKTLRRELRIWLQDAKILTPVDTGALQESGRLNVRAEDERNFAIAFPWFVVFHVLPLLR